MAPRPISMGSTSIPSSTSRFPTQSPTPNGRARICRRKPNGNSPRGGLDGAEFAWGDVFMPDGICMANTWLGDFPRHNHNEGGYEHTSPVTAFPPNGYGLHDVIGNVWEWTCDWYAPNREADAAKPCCFPQNPRGGNEDASYDPRLP